MFSYTNSTYVDLAMKKLYFRKYGVRFLCDSHYLTVTSPVHAVRERSGSTVFTSTV